MLRLTRSALALAVLIPAAGCVGTEEPSTTDSAIVAESEQTCPDFTTAGVRKMYCQVAMVGLLASPKLFSNQRVFTYGYLIRNVDGESALVLEPRFKAVPDATGCVGIKSFAPDEERKLDHLRAEEFYSVAMGGIFRPSPPGMCVGVLDDVEISDIAPHERVPDSARVW